MHQLFMEMIRIPTKLPSNFPVGARIFETLTVEQATYNCLRDTDRKLQAFEHEREVFQNNGYSRDENTLFRSKSSRYNSFNKIMM